MLAITGHTGCLEDPARVRDAGIVHVLVKPCELDEMVRERRKMLTGHGPQASPAAG